MMKFFGNSSPSKCSNVMGSRSKNDHSNSTTQGMTGSSGTSSVYQVTVPDSVQSGQEFQAYAGNQIVRVKCPLGCRPGQVLRIVIPCTDPEAAQPIRFTPDSDNVMPVRDRSGTYVVTIPPNIAPNEEFPVTVQGVQLMVTCPLAARPGMQVMIRSPLSPIDGSEAEGATSNVSTGRSSTSHCYSGESSPSQGSSDSSNGSRRDDGGTQLFEVIVPKGVRPGATFALKAGDVRVLVTCPHNAGPGQRIRFKLPKVFARTPKPQKSSTFQRIKLEYSNKDGWARTIRATDLKFQWIRMDEHGEVDQVTSNTFDTHKSSYVRQLVLHRGADPQIRCGSISLVPASRAVVDSRIKRKDGRDLVSYSDIAKVQVQDFARKAEWFQKACAQLCVDWSDGHVAVRVRRQFLLGDSVDAVMSLSPKDLRKIWRFEFIGESGIDAGGLAREWFQLVTEKIFDPDMGLWQSSATNQMCMQINPASGRCCEDHLVYYRFLGRVMGKALFDGQLVAGHMVQTLYKHFLGWPIQFKDLETADAEYYYNLRQLEELAVNGEDLSMLCLDFTTSLEVFGENKEIPLVEGGSNKAVNNDNFAEYMEACLRYKLMGMVEPQLCELLLGFFDVIPEPLLTVFDFQELELLMCGLPDIDMRDWQQHTEYSGEYDKHGPAHPTCLWFWEVVAELDQEMKARLLQFVTGTSGVPARGFGVLQGNDGSIRKFTIHGVALDVCLYPRAHTCFNRIDLPLYESKEELQEKLQLAISMVSTGFDLE